MTTLEILLGAHRDWPLQCWLDGSRTAATFAATDALAAYVYRGQDQAQLFAPAVDWYTAGATQTGYDQGQVQVTITSAQSAALEANGTYTLVVWRTPSGSSEEAAIWRGELLALPAAGDATQAITTYCSLADLLNYAPWIRSIQEQDTDQEGFYSQRLEAREWLDWLIVKQWRGGTWGVFGDASYPASEWSGWGTWRTPMPSPYLQDMLAGGFVPTNNAVTLTAAGSGYTSAPTISVPAPPALPQNRSAAFTASLDGTGGVGSITVADMGRGYAPGQMLTLTFSGGGGSGAAATATASAGTLIVREQVRRLCCYKAIELIGRAQIGISNQYASYAQYYADKVEEEWQQCVAELDINGDGLADIAVPLGRTNTMYE